MRKMNISFYFSATAFLTGRKKSKTVLASVRSDAVTISIPYSDREREAAVQSDPSESKGKAMPFNWSEIVVVPHRGVVSIACVGYRGLYNEH